MDKKYILASILLISAALSLYGLSRGDTVNDEVFMSFRGIRMMDFNEAANQTTPLEWNDPNIPWWTNLSFHDHPALVPLTQHAFMKIFGENNFAFRLPSALLGIASVYLLYLIGIQLYSANIGLLAAALFGITLNHIYISRVGMQEAYVIFFLLLGSHFFLKSLKNPRCLLWVALAAGLGAESKYNALILIPIFLTYLLIFRREYFKNKYFWLGIAVFTAIFSPSIIYNLKLYQTTGHFDFQFSYIFGQHPEIWKVAPGKDIGGLSDRIKNFIPRMISTNSWLFLSLAALSLASLFISLFKNLKESLRKNAFLLIAIFYLAILILLIGPSYRFLTMLTPFLALSAAIFLIEVSHYFNGKFALLAIVPILLFEIFYSINNQIIYYPVGPAPWFSSKVRYENYNWGYNELGQWLEHELKGKMPGLTFDLQYKFLDGLRGQAIEKGLAENLVPYPALFVYDGNFDLAAKLWVLSRLHIYHGWPIIDVKTYFDYLQQNGFDYYDRIGFKTYYFILENNIVPSPASQTLMRGEPVKILNPRGEEVFNIYKY